MDRGYCDIQGFDSAPCLEIDLLEGNRKAVQTTLHTAEGHGTDGRSCNQDGCVANLGKDPSTAYLYGPGARIDSSRPFTVSATFRESPDDHGVLGAAFDVTLMQDGRIIHFFDPENVGGSHSSSGRPAPLPSEDRARTRQALLECAV